MRYDYKCPKCGEIVEHTHSITEDPSFTCRACGAPMVRWIHPAPSHFKGGGWANDNYCKD